MSAAAGTDASRWREQRRSWLPFVEGGLKRVGGSVVSLAFWELTERPFIAPGRPHDSPPLKPDPWEDSSGAEPREASGARARIVFMALLVV